MADTPEAKAVRAYVAENQGLSGTAKVALHGFLDQATFGVYGAVKDHEDGKDPLEKAKAEALKQDHAIANIAGQVGGFGASILAGGGIFRAAGTVGRLAEGAVLGERILAANVATKMVQAGVPAAEAAEVGAGLARRIIANGAKWAGEGAVFAAPKAITEAALGDPERAGETLLMGVAGGAVLGLAGGTAGNIGRAMAGSMKGLRIPGGMELAGKIRKWGDDEAIHALNLSQKYAKRLGDRELKADAARIFREKGIGELAGDTEAITAKLVAERDATGAGIERIYRAADEAGADTLTTAADLHKAMNKAVQKEGLEAMGLVSAQADVGAWVDSEIMGPIIGTAIEGEGGKLTLEQLHKIRVRLDRITKFDQALTKPVNELRLDLRHTLTDLIDSKLAVAEGAVGRDLRGELKSLNKDYSVLSILAGNAEDRAAAGSTNLRPSITDRFGSLAGQAIGGMVGGVPGAMVGGIAGADGSR